MDDCLLNLLFNGQKSAGLFSLMGNYHKCGRTQSVAFNGSQQNSAAIRRARQIVMWLPSENSQRVYRRSKKSAAVSPKASRPVSYSLYSLFSGTPGVVRSSLLCATWKVIFFYFDLFFFCRTTSGIYYTPSRSLLINVITSHQITFYP